MRRPVLSLLTMSATFAVVGPSVAVGDAHPAVSGKSAHARKKCDRNYRGRCLKPNVSDYDCAGGSGNGPYYVRGPIRVVGNDHYRLDADGDGIACER
jgi:hypothetical protein